MSFIDEMKIRAKKDKKTVVLPEAMDPRILKATEIILAEKIADIILIGNESEIKRKAGTENINIDNAKIVDSKIDKKVEIYAKKLSEIDKKMSFENAIEMIKKPVFFGMMMVKMGDGDGLVSGAMNTTKDILKTAMRIYKKEGTKILSTSIFMLVSNPKQFSEEKVYVFSDCALNENPGYIALSEIAISSAKTYEKFTNKKAKVAMLSYSTLGSAKSKSTEKVIKATERAKSKFPDLIIDGEMQLDSAIIPEVANFKAPKSKIKGDANVLVFPNINAGNIGYKLVERLGNAKMFGPICQGLEKPINDLSRGCSVEEIVGTVVVTAIQARKE